MENISSKCVVSNVLKNLNLKDKLTDDDMTKLAFCITSELLAEHALLDMLPFESEQKRHLLVDHMVEFLSFDQEKMSVFGFAEFAKYGYEDGVPPSNNNHLGDEFDWNHEQ